MIDQILAQWNIHWDAVVGASLHRSDVSLRWKGALELEPGTSTGTIGNLYDKHCKVAHSILYISGKPKKGQLPSVDLELFINVQRVRF